MEADIVAIFFFFGGGLGLVDFFAPTEAAPSEIVQVLGEVWARVGAYWVRPT